MSSISLFKRSAIAIGSVIIIAGCGKQADAPAARPPGQVSIVTIAPQSISINAELPGRLEATRIAQVRARVPGIVLQRTFREGSDVKAGEVLFRIDPAPLQAAFASAEASLARAEATQTQTSLKATRYKPLVEVNAVSKQEYDDAIAAQQQANADVATARAARLTAGLNLGYATVTSPIAGRIGRALVTEGALVGQASDATQMALVQQLDPIYVNLTQSSTDLLKLQQAMNSGTLKGVAKPKISLITEDGSTYPLPGKLLFADLAVDENTGMVSLRAEFPNPKHTLLPGMYVRAKLEQAINDQTILVPQQAVTRDLNGASVLVVGPDNKVALRTVETGASNGNNWIITNGLKAGDRVIVEGMQKTKPGAPVTPVPWQGPVGQAAAAPAPAPATPPAPAAAKP
ncbi:efflux RND transporter periplasmic adaptor subunit [Herbaspirillum sp. RTI4]|uniref:efflux RND transporter periplasmic adaptor subunit n=1 Tax=Herbaspirillum sp. RTI4 TaxID=3048640 RepID=UPI002AB5A38E|nr:efflux RND transporter periplasmic adaptor subunit [Herbaspirillum sp. RTI4]MDY7577636.1 efflux RND transporter periplasmic adaptor subunit [Herbaspirillum sp. RTI4]MEA9982198.1 efflux RND transporter periplasmic adaptor subunit [Herbaspirillum sp. RTI4]